MTPDIYLRVIDGPSWRPLCRVRVRSRYVSMRSSVHRWKRRTIGTVRMGDVSCFTVPIRIILP